jgi:predicted HicB family RNase H-like nuclease
MVKSETIHIRISKDLKDAAERAAEKENRSLSNWIETAIRNALEKSK